MIRSKYHERVAAKIARVNEIQQPADLVIDINSLCVVVVATCGVVQSLVAHYTRE